MCVRKNFEEYTINLGYSSESASIISRYGNPYGSDKFINMAYGITQLEGHRGHRGTNMIHCNRKQ